MQQVKITLKLTVGSLETNLVLNYPSPTVTLMISIEQSKSYYGKLEKIRLVDIIVI